VVFDTSLPNHEDWDLWMRLSYEGADFLFIPQELAVYRVGTQSMSRSNHLMWLGFQTAIQKQLKLLETDDEAIAYLRYLSRMCDCIYRKGVARWSPRLAKYCAQSSLPSDFRKSFFEMALSEMNMSHSSEMLALDTQNKPRVGVK